MVTYAPTLARPRRPRPTTAISLLGITLAGALVAGHAWLATPRDISAHPAPPEALHSEAAAPLVRQVASGDDPYEIQGDRRPDALVLLDRHERHPFGFPDSR